MNSNLFPLALDTSSAKTFIGIEALMYQGENFLSALVGGIKKIKEKGKFDTASVKEANLSGIANKFTGMNVTISIEQGWGAYMYMPPMDNSHPFQNNYFVDYPLFASSGEMILRGKGDPIAEINYKDATVGGVYSDVPVSIYIGKDFFKSHFTSEEIAAILLHELGHAFTYFYYLGRMFFANFLISSYAQEIVGTRDVDKRKILIKAAERRLGTELYNPNALAEQPSLDKNKMETLFINAHRYTLANTTGTDIYDFRSCEQLADYFATMHGAGPHLISGLNKFYEMCGHDAILPYPIYLIGEFFKLLLTPLTLPVSLLIIMVTNPSIKRYDDPAARAKYIEMQMRGTLKNRNLDPEMRKSLLASIEAAGKHANRLSDHKGLDHLLWTVLSPSYRRGVKQEQSQKILEGILFNDLYQKAAIFDSIEEFNPLVDDAVVALLESRKDALEDDMSDGVNFNELDSDVNYLNEVQASIIETGEVSNEQLNSINAIVSKYKLDSNVSNESFKLEVVSTEALTGFAIGAIVVAIAAIAAIIWKIIKKLNESGGNIKNAPKQITQKSKALEQIEKPMANIAAQKPKVVEVIKAATNAGAKTPDEIDKALAQIDKELKARLGITKELSNIVDKATKPNPLTPEPQKPVANPLPLRMSNSPMFGILGRVIDDDFTSTSISFAKLYAIHCRLDPELVKKFGPKGLEDLKQLGVYIDYFFNDTIKGHLHKYLKANSKHYVNTSINTVEGLNATISRANRVGNQLDVLINGMITAIKPETIRAYFKKYGSVDDKKVPRIMGSKLSLGNYLNHYFTPQMLASIAPKYGNNTPEIVDDLVNSARLMDFGSSTILDAPILNKLDKVTITDSIDVTSINTRVAKLLKQLESSKEHLITEASKVFEEEIKKSGTENPDRLIGYVNKGLGEYIQDMFDAIKYFERDLAEISTWLLFVNKHMNRMISFYKASTVMYIEYVNTPG